MHSKHVTSRLRALVNGHSGALLHVHGLLGPRARSWGGGYTRQGACCLQGAYSLVGEGAGGAEVAWGLVHVQEQNSNHQQVVPFSLHI